MKKILVIFLTALTLFAGCGEDSITSQFDLTALDAKIAEAKSALEGVEVAENASDVAKGRKFVTSADMKKFTDAIASAELVRLAPISQSTVDIAVGNLDTAIYMFTNRDMKTGTKESGFSQDDLNKLIKEAEVAKDIVKTSTTNGADISPQEYWVTPTVMTALTTAISSAKDTSGTIDSKYTALNTAYNNFNNAKKPGTAASWRSITITGLSVQYPNGTEIAAGLFETNNINVNEEPPISGFGLISSGMATIVFYNKDKTLWTKDGSYYVGFMIKDKVYISNSKIAFNSAAYKPSAKYSDFKEFAPVYQYKCGDIASYLNYTIPSNGIALNILCIRLAEATYPELIASGKLPGPFYKDQSCSPTQAYTLGTEIITADTILYSKFNLMSLLEENSASNSN